MSEWSKFLIIFVGVVALVAIGASSQFGGWSPAEKGSDQHAHDIPQSSTPTPAAKTTPAAAPAAGGKQAPSTVVGPKDAPVKMTVFYNSENSCHQQMATLPRQLVSGNAKDVQIRFVDTANPEGAEECNKVANCQMGGIAINGQASWTMASAKGGGNPMPVMFHGACEHSGSYGWEHVKAALAYSLEKAGRKPAPVLASQFRVVEDKAAR